MLPFFVNDVYLIRDQFALQAMFPANHMLIKTGGLGLAIINSGDVVIGIGGKTFDDVHYNRTRLWSNIGLLETVLWFLLPLVSVPELIFHHVCDSILFITTVRIGVSGRVCELILLPHDWKSAMCHFKKL